MLWFGEMANCGIGRTARIGNEGLATSFYNDHDVGLGPFLTKILLECGQEIPDFLQDFKPEGGVLNFDEEEEPDMDEPAGGNEAEGDAWGADNGNTGTAENGHTDDAWGSGGDGNAAAASADAWTAGNDASAGASW